MNVAQKISAHRQLLQMIGITSAAFLVALPIGAAVMPRNSVVSADTPTVVTRTIDSLGSCTTGTAGKSAAKTTTHTVVVPATHTNTVTNTQTSTNDHGATAQVGHDGIAAAVNVGDVLSHNNVPVLSNNNILSGNATTVSPTVNLLNGNLAGNTIGSVGSLLGGIL